MLYKLHFQAAYSHVHLHWRSLHCDGQARQTSQSQEREELHDEAGQAQAAAGEAGHPRPLCTTFKVTSAQRDTIISVLSVCINLSIPLWVIRLWQIFILPVWLKQRGALCYYNNTDKRGAYVLYSNTDKSGALDFSNTDQIGKILYSGEIHLYSTFHILFLELNQEQEVWMEAPHSG